MFTSQQFSEVLWKWTGIFMHRSTLELNQIMKKSGLSMPQLTTLMRLYFHSGCGISDIGTYVGITNAAASQMVDRLVIIGLLERKEDPQDRRVKKLALTSKGRALIQDTIEIRQRWMKELTIELSAEEQQSIINALTLLSEAARKLETSN